MSGPSLTGVVRKVLQLVWGRRMLDVLVIREGAGPSGEEGRTVERVAIAIRYAGEADEVAPCPCRPGLWCTSLGW
jgi:hypothetical protein